MTIKKKHLAAETKRILDEIFSLMLPTMIICSCGAKQRVQFEGLQRGIAEKFIADHAHHKKIEVKTLLRPKRRRSTVGEHPF